MDSAFVEISREIINDPMNSEMKKLGYMPLFAAGYSAKVAIIGQAPGIKAQQAGIAWGDKSGENLREWMGVNSEQFYNPNIIALLPMDFYFPGKGKHGDLPPRKDFAKNWHPPLLRLMPDIQLTILLGSYAQKYYLKETIKPTLTETVRHYAEYLPRIMPLPHPSPLNFRWQAKNPWFLHEVIPTLQTRIAEIIE